MLVFQALHSNAISSTSDTVSFYANIPQLEEKARFWPIEINTHWLVPVPNPNRSLVHDDLDWVKQNWLEGGILMNSNSDFNAAVQAFDSSINMAKPSVSLMMLWGAIEHLFSPAKQELRFRLSATLASFLEPPGYARIILHKKIMKLYDARSKVAHGVGSEEVEPLVETRALLKRALVKIIEDRHVPTRAELEAALFGSG